jgi:hypothetical protein
MFGKTHLAASAVGIAVALSGQPAMSQETGAVTAGVLICDVATGVCCSGTELNGTITDTSLARRCPISEGPSRDAGRFKVPVWLRPRTGYQV